MTTGETDDAVAEVVWLAEELRNQAQHMQKVLVLGVRKDGSSFIRSWGIGAGEAKTMAIHFETWLERMEAEAERADRPED